MGVTKMKLFAIVISGLVLGACATMPKTRFQSSWQDATFSGGPFHRIAVLANFKTQSDSREFEQEVANALRNDGVEAIEGHSFLQDGKKYTEQQMRQQMGEVNADGILISKLIAVDKDRTYAPPAPYLGGIPDGIIYGDPFYWYYYPNWDYYWYWRSGFAVTRQPGYWVQHRYLVIETSLYDRQTNELVWTAKSRTMDDTEFSRLAGSVALAVTQQLSALNLISGTGGSSAADNNDSARQHPSMASARPTGDQPPGAG
jgi:hypothetical protein